jgi:hypothetical protein
LKYSAEKKTPRSSSTGVFGFREAERVCWAVSAKVELKFLSIFGEYCVGIYDYHLRKYVIAWLMIS